MIAIRGSNNVHTTGTVTATERDGGRQRRSRRAQCVYDVENVEEDGEEDWYSEGRERAIEAIDAQQAHSSLSERKTSRHQFPFFAGNHCQTQQYLPTAT